MSNLSAPDGPPNYPLEKMRGGRGDGDYSEDDRIAARLLAGLYHNPDHIPRVQAEDPVMPNEPASVLWEALQAVYDPDGFDTVRLDNILAEHEGSTGARARSALKSIRNHDTLGPVEAATFGHKGEQLERWAATLAESAAKRRLATALGSRAAEIQQSGGDLSLEEIQTRVLGDVQGIVGGATRGGLLHISEYLDDALEDVDRWEAGELVDFVPTGFYGLDEMITGVPVSELTIFAAPSGAGKTSWLLQLLRQIAVRNTGEAVALFSIEMPAKKVLHRAAAAWGAYAVQGARQNPQAFATRDAASGDRVSHAQQHRRWLQRLSDLPLYVDEDPEPTLGQIQSRVMQVKARHEVALIGVDYDEKVKEEEAPASEELRVAEISRGLKTMAKRLTCATVALSQYNSSPSGQVRPGTNDDLRYSRKKKHEASLILHWYWPEYWVRSGDVNLEEGDNPPPDYDPTAPERGYLYVGKNRDGRTGRIPLDFHADRTAFTDPNDPEGTPGT